MSRVYSLKPAHQIATLEAVARDAMSNARRTRDQENRQYWVSVARGAARRIRALRREV